MKKRNQATDPGLRMLFAAFIAIFLASLGLVGVYFYKTRMQTKTIQPPQPVKKYDASNIFNPPKKEASKEEKDAHARAIAELAEDADAIIITTCNNISPKVIRTYLHEDLTFTNNDSFEHTIAVRPEFTFKIPPGESHTINNGSGNVGVYGYACDKIGLAGFIFMLREHIQ